MYWYDSANLMKNKNLSKTDADGTMGLFGRDIS